MAGGLGRHDKIRANPFCNFTMLKQRTLKALVRTTGVGLHSGLKVNLTLRPAAPDTGIVFRRVDLDPPVDLRADPMSVGDTQLASCLEKDGARIATIEHLMSALAGLGIDNLWVDVDAAELPIVDGSASPFIYLLQSVGIEEQPAPKRFVRVLKSVEVKQGDKWARLDPYDGFRLSFSIVFDHPVLEKSGTQAQVDFADNSYIHEISRARTFGFMQDVEYLHSRGLAQGGSLENAIVMDEYRVLNAEGLRYADEFVKHKILDAVGDLYILGHPLLASFTAHKSGHALNNLLLRELLADQSAWEYVSFARSEDAPSAVQRLFPALVPLAA